MIALNLRKSFLQSFWVHITIAFLAVGFPSIYKYITKRSLFETKIRKIPEAVRVDLVGMPTLTVKELERLPRIKSGKIDLEKQVSTTELESKLEKKAAPVKVEKKEEVIKKNDTVLLKNKKSKKKKKNKKKNTKKGIKSKAGKKAKNKAAEELRNLILMGNQLSKGELATGEVSDVDLTELDRYALKVKNRIKPHWNLPSFLLDLDLRARVRIYINKEGELIRMSLIDKSGNAEYDNRVRKAIELAEPFDAPAKNIREAVEDGELVLVFPF